MRKLALVLSVAASSAFAQVAPKPADAILAVVGSTQGQSNANFRTELQLANGSDGPMSGWLVLRPQNLIARYELAPHATRSYADVVAELGASGIGSLDLLVDRGGVPAIVARAYDDQPTGSTGVTVPAVRPGEALSRGEAALLIVPRDLTRYRFNLGVRTLESGATIDYVVRNAGGAEKSRGSLTWSADTFDQRPADVMLSTALAADDSVELRLFAGSAIVYATTVDNRTNDSSLQLGRRP
ncbi:MAG TPA: hypothetical protein VF824_22835 [Thermoanaerobaculia bacterium]